MNVIKVDGQYINMENVTTVSFFTSTVQRLDEQDSWSLAYGYEMPDYQKRQALIANVYFTDGRDENSSSATVIDAEPLQKWLDLVATDLDAIKDVSNAT